MITIWKYIIKPPTDGTMIVKLDIPLTGEFVSAIEQFNEIVVYVRFKLEYASDLRHKELLVLPTGLKFDDTGMHLHFINTVMMSHGSEMYHIFHIERIGRV